MLPNQSILTQIPQQILNIPNQRKESKRKIHYCCYLLGRNSGLRVSEAVNFDLNAKTKKGLYRLNKTKGQKKRYVYIPKAVIKELKKHNWKPQQTNRFNFYHFLKRIKRELGISQNIELTPHTLRRSFATYHAENGLPLPFLSKLLGHKSVRTTALYWMNIYHGEDDDNDADSILAGKIWLERPKSPPLEPTAPAQVNFNELPEVLTPHPLASEQPLNYLSKICQLESQLSQIQDKNNSLKEKNTNLQGDLAELSQQKSYETAQREQIQQKLTEKEQIIKQLEKKLADEREKRLTAENNLVQGRQNNQSLQETNTNLTQKLDHSEQTIISFQNAYQKALNDKAKAEKQVNYYENQLKSIAKMLHQRQKINYYQQLEEKQEELKAQIVQPPPGKIK